MAIKDNGPVVSVLVATYNYGRYIEAAVRSILAQTHINLECIVIDDGSTDNTSAVLAEIVDHRLVVRQQENAGQAMAWNAAFAQSRGEYVFFCDADDYFYPSKVEYILGHLEAGVTLYHHDLDEVDEAGSRIGDASFGGFTSRTGCSLLEGDLRARLVREFGWYFAPSTGIMLPRRVADQIFPIAPHFRLCADVALAYGGGLAGRVKLIPQSLGAYRLHSRSGYAAHYDNSYRWSIEQFVNTMQRYSYVKTAVDMDKFGCRQLGKVVSPLENQSVQVIFYRCVEPLLILRLLGLLSLRLRSFYLGNHDDRLVAVRELFFDIVSCFAWSLLSRRRIRKSMEKRALAVWAAVGRREVT